MSDVGSFSETDLLTHDSPLTLTSEQRDADAPQHDAPLSLHPTTAAAAVKRRPTTATTSDSTSPTTTAQGSNKCASLLPLPPPAKSDSPTPSFGPSSPAALLRSHVADFPAATTTAFSSAAVAHLLPLVGKPQTTLKGSDSSSSLATEVVEEPPKSGQESVPSFAGAIMPASAPIPGPAPWPSPTPHLSATGNSAVRRTLDHIPEVDSITALFAFDRRRHVLGAGMYATVYRALPTLEACRRFDLPVIAAAPADVASTTTTTAAATPGSTGGSPTCSGGGPPARFPNRQHSHQQVAPVALKEVELASIVDAKEARNVLREISVLRRLRHPHVAGFVGAVRTKTCIYIAMPLAPGVTLTKLLKASQESQLEIPEKAVSAIAHQLLSALRHVHHERCMVHRDVKLDNVLVAAVDPKALLAERLGSAGERSNKPASSTQTTSSAAAASAGPHASGPSAISSSSGGGRRESTNKPDGASNIASAESHASALPMSVCPGTTTPAAVAPPLLALGDMLAPCDPAAVLSRLFEPHAEVHVTLVDFGFARTVPGPVATTVTTGVLGATSAAHRQVSPATVASAAAAAAAAAAALSPIATPTSVSPGPVGRPKFPATATPIGPTSASERSCSPPQASPAPPATTAANAAAAGGAVAGDATKLAYTPCGAHRFMPPEALGALLKSGHLRRTPHASPTGIEISSAAAADVARPSAGVAERGNALPAARGEAPGTAERDVAPVDAPITHRAAGARDILMMGASNAAAATVAAACGNSTGARNTAALGEPLMPRTATDASTCSSGSASAVHEGELPAETAALVGGDSDIGSIGAGLAFATAAELRKADPFAVGVVCYALLSACFPWHGDTPARLLDTMRGGVRMKSAAWGRVSDDGKDFVRSLLRHNPADRPSVEHALAHRWLQVAPAVPPPRH